MSAYSLDSTDNEKRSDEGHNIEIETDTAEEDAVSEVPEEAEQPKEEGLSGTKASIEELHDKYVRLYAEFDNYKKVSAKQRSELLKYSNEHIMNDLLTVIDHLELALQHASGDGVQSSLTEGVEMTLRELKSILEKHGLSYIETLDKPFDPNIHHAMSQIDAEDVEENTVVKEFRKGYRYKERVLRASLVGVSRKPLQEENEEQ